MLWPELWSPTSYVEVLTPSTSESENMWTKDPYVFFIFINIFMFVYLLLFINLLFIYLFLKERESTSRGGAERGTQNVK